MGLLEENGSAKLHMLVQIGADREAAALLEVPEWLWVVGILAELDLIMGVLLAALTYLRVGHGVPEKDLVVGEK